MKHLALYPSPPRSNVDDGGEALERGTCSRCIWSAGPGRACLSADGQPGGLLVVGGSPVKDAARPFASRSGAYVRKIISQFWNGPVVFDYAIKCPAPAKAQSKDAQKPMKECRPFLASVVGAAKPQRVLSLGPWAAQALVGRALDMESVRRGYGWIKGDVPVFFAHDPLRVLENKFMRKRFEGDLRWALTVDRPTPRHLDGGVVHVVENADDATRALEVLSEFDELLFDVETAGIPHGEDFTVLCAGLAPVDKLETDAWVWSARALRDPDARGVMQALLSTKKISGSNLKYDMIAAEQCLDVVIPKVEFDTQLVRKLAEPTCKGRLEYAVELVGMGGSKEETKTALRVAKAAARRKKWREGDKPHDHWCVQAIKNGTPGGSADNYSYGLLSDDMLHRYNGRDVVSSATAALLLKERTEATAPGEMKLWNGLLQGAVPSFKRIEMTGFNADRQAFEAFAAHLKIGLDDLRQQFKAYGKDFNPNSVAQIRKILFEDLRLPKLELKESGVASTEAAVLEKMRGMHPFVDQVLEYRKLEKMDGTYATGMMAHILSDGRIHPTFRLDGTETMRISSENPNGQNIPRAETIEGRMARNGFIASPGRIIVELDQSQIELRVAAGMSGDPHMIDIFKSGQDYHMRTAQLVSQLAWRIAEDAVTEWHRSYCKTINFGLLYGKTDVGLAQQLGCSVPEAAALRAAILGKFKKLAEMIKHLLYMVRRNGQIEIPWMDGAVHVRPLLEAGSHDKWKVSNAENAAVNSPIQGRAAMYTVASIPLIHAWIDDNKVPAQIVNTVHDSILLDVEPDAIDETVIACKGIMTSFDCWGVPLVADCKAGPSWGALRKIKTGEKYKDAEVRWAAEALKASST